MFVIYLIIFVICYSLFRLLLFVYFSYVQKNCIIISIIIQRKFVALCYNRFLSRDNNGYSYANALKVLNLRTLHDRRHQLDAIFVINVLLGSKSCPSTLDIIGLRVPTRNLRAFLCFMLVHFIKIVPPAGE
jgi:hypothetical protein